MSNSVVHFEIPTDDLDRARAFYESAFGWRISSMPGMGYALVGTSPVDERGAPTQPGAINGGMLLRQSPVTSVVITIDVDDMDAALAAVERLGGSVIRGREPVGDMGFAAYVRDTEGNVIGLWQSVRSSR